MWREVIYLRAGKQRPVRLAPYAIGEDLQEAIPAGWCEKCGREVYEFGKGLCPMCERWEQNEEKTCL